MSGGIVYIDTSDVREGALEELKTAIKELVDFIAANEPRLIAYNVYFSDDGTRMTVVHVHPDSYGEPSEGLLKQLHEKTRLLGRGAGVVLAEWHAGFARFAVR